MMTEGTAHRMFALALEASGETTVGHGPEMRDCHEFPPPPLVMLLCVCAWVNATSKKKRKQLKPQITFTNTIFYSYTLIIF